MSEWAHFRGDAPNGWCARTGQGKSPYDLSADPCGSSSGSAISVAANMAAVSLGTETDGSILCPSSYNSVVGIKPTVGDIMNSTASGEFLANAAEFKLSLNVYLEGLVSSPVRSLVDVIAFNKFSKLEKTTEYGQFLFETAQAMEGI